MAVSAVATLWIGRDTTFSGDELVWVVTSPDFDLRTAFQPHAGHLLLIPRTLYSVLLELFGLSYLPYRILTVLAVILLVGLLFTWLSRRIPARVALAPCLVLLFFGTDHLHILQGNGFTICFSLAMGVLALLMLERGDRTGDIAACAALIAGVATYSLALPFMAGVFTLLVLQRSWSRLWIPLLPLALYLVWFVWNSNQEFGGGAQANWSAIPDIPMWTFKAIAAPLYGLSGLHFDWSAAGETLDLVNVPSALIALAAIIAVLWYAFRGHPSREFWAVLVAGLALWTLQALGSDAQNRLPGDSRYMFPGAVICLLILGEVARNVRWSGAAVAGLYAVAAVGLVANFSLLVANGGFYRERAEIYMANAGAAKLGIQALVGRLAETGQSVPEPADPSELTLDPGTVAILMSDSPYGDFASTPEEMLEAPEGIRRRIDAYLVGSGAVGWAIVEPARSGTCREVVRTGDGAILLELPPGDSTVTSDDGIEQILVGRFADRPTVPLGGLEPGRQGRISLPRDGARVPWQVAALGAPEVSVCTPD